MSLEQQQEAPSATSIQDSKNTEICKVSPRSKKPIFKRVAVFKDYTTTAAYVDSLVFDKRLFKTALITIKEKGGAQSIYYKVLGSIDPKDWHEIQGETSLAAAGHVAFNMSDPWTWVKLQAKNNSGVGTIDAFISEQTP